MCTHGKKLLIKMRTILKGLAHKSAFDVSSSFPVKLEMRCVFFLRIPVKDVENAHGVYKAVLSYASGASATCVLAMKSFLNAD